MSKRVSFIGRSLVSVSTASSHVLAPPPKLPPWAVRTMDGSTGGDSWLNDIEPCYQFLRSTRNLIVRSSFQFSDLGKRLTKFIGFLFSEDGFEQKLDSGILIHFLVDFGAGPERSYRERRVAFGLDVVKEPILSEAEERLRDWLAEGSVACRRSMWQYRASVAVEECVVSKGWFGIFGTYTVDPAITDSMGLDSRDDLWTRTDAWDRFLKSVKAEVAGACGYGRNSGKWPPVADWFQYFGVLEHGSSGAHPHIHVLFLCRDIPRSWKRDPNLMPFCKSRTERDIKALSALWPFGSQCMSIGLHMYGSWFTDNWLPPCEVKDNKLVECACGNALSVSKYVAKYVQKGTRVWKHRVKSTKGLGLSGLIRKVSEIQSDELLNGLASKPREYGQYLALQVSCRAPLKLIRTLCKRELMRRWRFSEDASDKILLRKELTRQDSGCFMSLMNSARDSVQLWKHNKGQLFSFFTLISPDCVMDLSEKLLVDMRAWLVENVGRPLRSVESVKLNVTGFV